MIISLGVWYVVAEVDMYSSEDDESKQELPLTFHTWRLRLRDRRWGKALQPILDIAGVGRMGGREP